jgi:hypothetical protein
MNCTIVQRRLLSLTSPERVPTNLRAHLAHCGVCREWHNQLILVERHISLLPIPRSNGKSRLMRLLLQENAPANNGSETLPQAAAPTPLPVGDARSPTLLPTRTLVLGAAAAMLVIILGCGDDPLR